MKRLETSSTPTVARYDRILKEEIHDTYKQRRKAAGKGRCTECQAVYTAGRWIWSSEAVPDAEAMVCPACCRIRDDYPAGELFLRGDFIDGHAEEIRNLITNIAREQADEHPLKRIIAISEQNHDWRVTTTDIHLPHQIGHALHDAYEGDLDVHYDDEGYFARVEWRRDR